MNVRKIKSIFNKISEIVDKEINLMDDSAYIIESTNKEKIGEYDEKAISLKFNNLIEVKSEYSYYRVNFIDGNKYLISIQGVDLNTQKLLQVISTFISEDMRYLNKEEFVKDLLTGKVDNKDVDVVCKKFGMNLDMNAQVIVIKVDIDNLNEVENILSQIYEDDVIIKINNEIIVFFSDQIEEDNKAQQIYDIIYSELLYEPKIGVGNYIDSLLKLQESFNKGNIAIELGNIFLQSTNIYYYSELGIPLLIKNMSPSDLNELRKDMNNNINEILLDKELVMTAAMFFENNLNVSEAAKKLYIHRNTLIYRINKIQNICGYDLRNFEEAINFKINMLIHSYFKTNK